MDLFRKNSIRVLLRLRQTNIRFEFRNLVLVEQVFTIQLSCKEFVYFETDEFRVLLEGNVMTTTVLVLPFVLFVGCIVD